MAPKKEPKKGGGPQSNDTNSTDNSIIEEVPTNFDELTRMIRDIQSSVKLTEGRVEKLVNNIEVLEEKLVKAEERVVEVEKSLELIIANHDVLLKRIKFLENQNKDRANESHHNKVILNTVQQRFRMQSIRVYNMSRQVKSSREAAVYLYDSLFKHVFKDPVSGHDPGAFRVIEYCHILPCMPGKEEKYEGFNYILRFASRFWKQLFFDSKGETVDSYNKTNRVKIKISHDYSYQNRICLFNLHKDPLVQRVTFRGDRVMFKTDVTGPWKTVTDPFGATARDMVAKEIESE